jgi:hypothetical protein
MNTQEGGCTSLCSEIYSRPVEDHMVRDHLISSDKIFRDNDIKDNIKLDIREIMDSSV